MPALRAYAALAFALLPGLAVAQIDPAEAQEFCFPGTYFPPENVQCNYCGYQGASPYRCYAFNGTVCSYPDDDPSRLD